MKYIRNMNHFRYPFDKKTLIGFIFASILQTMITFPIVFLFVIQMNFVGGFIWFAYAFTSDIKECLRDLNVDLKSLEIGQLTAEKRIEIFKKMAAIVRFHSTTTK